MANELFPWSAGICWRWFLKRIASYVCVSLLLQAFGDDDDDGDGDDWMKQNYLTIVYSNNSDLIHAVDELVSVYFLKKKLLYDWLFE